MTTDYRLPATDSFSRRHRLLWAALIVAACAVVYANGTSGTFTYDDKAIIRDNPRIRSPRSLGQIFSTSYFGGPRGTGSAYRPLLLVSYAVEWWLHGREAFAFHVVNVLFHAAATLLLASLLLRIGLARPAVLAAALLFAVHPIHVEAVTSLVGRGETQMALFVLLYLHLALTWAGRGTRDAGREMRRLEPEVRNHTEFEPDLPRFAFRRGARRFVLFVLALLCYAAALLTKESGAIAPALAFLLFAFLAEGSLPARLWAALLRGLPLFAASATVLGAVFALRRWVLGGALRSPSTGIFEVENPLTPLSPAARMANACVVFFRYLGRCVFPLHLTADESAWSIRPVPVLSPLAVAAMLLLLLLAVASLARLRSRSVPALGFLFFGLASLPTGNLLFPIGTVFAERVAYLPSAGACLALGALLAGGNRNSGFTGNRRRALVAVALLFSVRTILRNAVWWSDDGLFANLAATAPGSAKAHYDVAYAAADERRYREAREQYLRAVAIYEGYWDAWAGKGRVEKEMGLLAEAERSYEKSIAIHAKYENGYFGLGRVREARGDDTGAERAYRQGLEQVPQSLPLAYRLAIVAGRLQRPTAAAEWDRALGLGGGLCYVRSDYARWLFGQGRIDAAAKQAREALRRDPGCIAALNLLADRAQREGMRLSRALALERIWRLTRSPADRKRFEEARRVATGG